MSSDEKHLGKTEKKRLKETFKQLLENQMPRFRAFGQGIVTPPPEKKETPSDS